MSAENKKIAQRIIKEVWSDGNLAIVDERYAADFSHIDPLAPGANNIEMYRQYVQLLHNAFPDMQFEITEQVAEGDKVAVRFQASGTHKGEMMGIPATGKEGSITGITTYHIVDGQVLNETSEWDALGLLQQLGVIPQMAP